MNWDRRISSILVVSAGNLVEWFDFYIYSFCAIYFAPAFFPQGNTTTQLLNTAGIFAAGFFMRPLGAWFFGRLADRQGRRLATIVSVLMMGGGSLAIACLPTYAQIGQLAPVLLLCTRLVQGFSVGGEYGVSAAYLSEVAYEKHRGLFASFQPMTLICGQLLALLSMMLLQHFLNDAQLKEWGWRLLFFVSALGALVVLWLRRSLRETTSAADRTPNAGTLKGLWQHKRSCLTILGLTASGSLTFYTFTTYMQKYLVNTVGLQPKLVSILMLGAISLCLPLYPLYGALSDKIGRKAMMIIFSALTACATLPLMSALTTAPSLYKVFALVLLALMIMIFYTSIGGLLKAEMFPTSLRALGVSLPFALANALFGGTAEYVALWTKSLGMESSFYMYVTAVALISLCISVTMPDARQQGYLKEKPL